LGGASLHSCYTTVVKRFQNRPIEAARHQMTRMPQELTMTISKLVAATAILTISSGAAVARDRIQIAGSSTVLPYASIVAEAFGENFDFPTPVVESAKAPARTPSTSPIRPARSNPARSRPAPPPA
jgi:hypothetical protein